MSFGSRYILDCHAKRFGRLLATLVILPALVMSPLTAQAILIHDHHGHDTHGHTVTLYDLDDLRENLEHQHEKHEHDGLPVDPPEDEGTPILIVRSLSEALRGARTTSAGTAVAAGIGTALRTLAVNSCVVDDGRPPGESQQTSANIPRAPSLIRGILLTSHALLL